MTHAIYIELLLITDDPNGKAAVNLAANAQTRFWPSLAKDFCKTTRRQFMPEIPAGRMFLRHSFWAQFEAKFIWEIAWGVLKATDERKTRLAAWLKERREEAVRRGDVWLPKPQFQVVYTLPMPKDGKDAANSWTPRT